MTTPVEQLVKLREALEQQAAVHGLKVVSFALLISDEEQDGFSSPVVQVVFEKDDDEDMDVLKGILGATAEAEQMSRRDEAMKELGDGDGIL